MLDREPREVDLPWSEPDTEDDLFLGRGEFTAAAAAAWRTYHPETDDIPGQLLTADQERDLARRIRAGDEEARRQLIAANYRLVFHVVSRFRYTGVPLEDLIQEGNVGLIEAADRFDEARGCRFNTYALLWIRGAVLRAVTRLREVIPVPERVAQAAVRLRRDEDELAQELQRLPSIDELSDRTGLPAQRVEAARHLLRTTSLQEACDPEEGRPAEEWMLASDEPSAPETLAQRQLARLIAGSLEQLTPRERDVVRLRFGLDTDEPRSLAAVGRSLRISRQRARELEQSALRRLRAATPRDLGWAAAAGD